MPKYLDVYPNSMADGIGLVSGISSLEVPWKEIGEEAIADVERAYAVRSGTKNISLMFNSLPETAKVNVIFRMFNSKWTKLWESYELEYNPIDAYMLTEEGTDNRIIGGNEATTYGHIITGTDANTGTVSTDSTVNSSGVDSVYGFNSASAVPSDTSTNNDTSTDTETRDLASNSETSHSGTDNRTKDETNTLNHTLTKRGNIGYNTPQELIRQELELWGTTFFERVFSDIDSFAMVQVY